MFSIFFLLEQKENKIQDNSPTFIFPLKLTQMAVRSELRKPAVLLPTYAVVLKIIVTSAVIFP
jgi:hypothetical protein